MEVLSYVSIKHVLRYGTKNHLIFFYTNLINLHPFNLFNRVWALKIDTLQNMSKVDAKMHGQVENSFDVNER